MTRRYLRKYFVMGSQDCVRAPEEVLEEAMQAGITAFQFREKGPEAMTGADKVKLGKRLRAMCKEHGVPFFINDDVDLIEELEVDGVHVGQDDMSVRELRKSYPKLQIGLSVSTREELNASALDVVDYIGAGPVFPTSSKADASAVVGVEWIATLRAEFPNMSIVGIGGITVDNAPDVLRAGADGVAVVSAISRAKDVDAAVAAL